MGLLVLHQQPHKLSMGERRLFRVSQPFLKASGQAKQLELVQDGHSLLIKHGFSSLSLIVFSSPDVLV